MRGALILNLLVLMAALAPNTMPSVFAAPMIPVESLLTTDGTLNTSTGINGAVDLRGWQVTLDSARGPVLTPQSPAPAKPSSCAWLPLTNQGSNGVVRALAVSGTDLYVGGQFATSKDGSVTNLNNIVDYGGIPTAVTLSSFQANAPSFELGAWLRSWFSR